MGKGSGSVDIPQRNWSDEWAQLKQGFKGNINQFNQFGQTNPLLKLLIPGAAEQFSAGDSPLLKETQQTGLDIMRRGQDIATAGPSPLLQKLTGIASADDYLSGHVSEQELANVVSDPLLAKFAMQGNAMGNQAAAKTFLDRSQYVEGRQAQHLDEAQKIEQLGGLDEARRFGIGQSGFTTGAGAEQLGEQAKGQRFDIARNVLGSGVSAFKGLTDPVWGYLSDLNSSNQNAAAAESVAGANKSSGTSSSIIGTVGTVAAAALTAY